MKIKVVSLFVILLLSISPSAFAYEPSGITQCLKKNYTQSQLQSLIHNTAIIGEDESGSYWTEGPAGPYNKTDWIYKLKELHEKRYGAAGGIQCSVNGKNMEIGSATLTEDCQLITTKVGNLFNKKGRFYRDLKNCKFIYTSIYPNEKEFKKQFRAVSIPLDFSQIYHPSECRGKQGAILGIALKRCAKKIPVALIDTKLGKKLLLPFEIEILPSVQLVNGKAVESTRYTSGNLLETNIEIKNSCGHTSATHNADITKGGSGAGLFIRNHKENIIVGIHHTGRYTHIHNINFATLFTIEDERAIKKIAQKLKARRLKKRKKK